MTTLEGTQRRNTYKDLVQVSNSNSGIDGTYRDIEDGEGTASGVQISTNGMQIPSGKTLVLASGSTLDLPNDAVATADINWSGTIDGDLVPDGTGTRDLGSAAARYAEMHADAHFLKDMQLQGFRLRFRNNAGTIEHCITPVGAEGGSATFDNQISGASSTFATTPTTGPSTDFTSGAGFANGATHALLFNTDAITQTDYIGEAVIASASNGISNVFCSVATLTQDVNGTNQRWFAITFIDNTGAAYAINTTNLATGKAVEVVVFVYIQ